MKDAKMLIEVASGRQPADLVFKNAQVVNVFTEEILVADVALQGGYIAGVGSYSGHKELDCTGKFICPGFIDAHLHIESTMVLPEQLVKMILPWGTTTLVADPHEIVNVCGKSGMQFMLDACEDLPCNMYFMLPSSVPATPYETSGADFTAEEMSPFIPLPHVLGLGEVMCYPDVVQAEQQILNKISALRGHTIDGHAPGLSGASLQAYAAAGIGTEHEVTLFAEALEKARAGLAILIREGSAAHNLASIVSGLVETGVPTGRFMFCTDDKHIDDINRDGHIRWNIKLAIDLGLSPTKAIAMATLNAARTYNLPDIGAIAPGYRADIVVLEDIEQMKIADVYKDGIPAQKRLSATKPFVPSDPKILHSVHLPPLSEESFLLRAQGMTDVIEMVPYQLTTRHLKELVPCKEGVFMPEGDYTKLCVIERHGRSGNIAVAPLKGYGLTGGAIATTVAHDSHNIIVAGDNDEDMLLAARHLADMQGGYVLVKAGQVVGTVPLEVAGLMSLAPYEQAQQSINAIIQQARSMGIPSCFDPFISLSFLALPVIPEIRLTDKGIFDVVNYTLL